MHVIRKFILLLTGLFLPPVVFSQLTVNTTMTPAQLVQNILVGTGVTVSNITYTGAAGSIGRFTTGGTPTNLGISNGILISTGQVNGVPAIGSSALNFASTDNGFGGDADLQSLISTQVMDASILQFDFVPLSDTIRFRYVFASEEYPEFVCSDFNDVFGFFVSGVNPLGGNYTNYNIARIPGTILPVAINSINSGSPGNASGIPYDTADCISIGYSMYYVNNANGTSIVFDGFTTVLTAWCLVTPCTTYHLKIAIGDAGDRFYDSGVFLEQNSFSSTGTISVQTTYSNPIVSTTDAIEGCNNAVITFSLPDITPTPRPVIYAISGTAINGTDYNTIPTSVIIPAGQSSVSLTISPFMDGIPEGTETVVFVVQTSICSTQTVTITILNNNPLSLVSSNDTNVCATSASIWVHPSGGISPYTYQWDHGAGTSSSATVSPLVSTTYHITVTDLCGSIATENVTITVNPLPIVTVIATPATICVGQSTTLNGVGAITYSWMPGVLSGTSVNITPAATTTYTVTGIAAGCSGSNIVMVTVNPNPVITSIANPATICQGVSSSLFANSSVGGTTYLWNPCSLSGTPVSVNPATTTTYSVTGTAAGCSGSNTVMVSVNPNPVITSTANPATICQGVSSSLSANSSVGGTTYLWNPCSLSGTPVSVTPATTTTYSVTGTASGCSGSNTVMVTVNPNPVITSTANPATICQGVSSSLSASSSVGGTTYIWNPCSLSGTPVSVTPATTTIYTVTGTAAGCSGSNTVMVTDNPNPVITPTAAPSTICNGASSLLSATSSVVGTTFIWDPGSISGTSISVSPTSTSIYTVNGFAAGCSGSNSIKVTVNPNPGVSPTAYPPNICPGASTSLSATSSLAGTTFVWNPGSLSGSPVTVNPSNTTKYTVTGIASGCTSNQTITVYVSTPVNITVIPLHDSVCPGGSVILSASGAITYQWFPSNSLSGSSGTQVISSPAVTTIYTITGTDNNGCTGTTQAIVSIYPDVPFTFTMLPSDGCEPLLVNFVFDTNNIMIDHNSLLYNFNDPSSVNNTSSDAYTSHLYNENGFYVVGLTANNIYGCPVSFADTVKVYKTPVADFAYVPEVIHIEDPMVHFYDQSYYANYWNWNFGDPSSLSNNISDAQNPSHLYSDTGSYEIILVVSSGHGCYDTAMHTINILPPFLFWLPNAFTPNGDATNNTFFGKGVGFHTDDFEMCVYDRWGKLMFSKTGYDLTGWDGSYMNRGKHCEQGVYAYLIKLTENNGLKHTYLGSIILIQ